MKKILVLVASVVLTVSMLAGCGSNNNANEAAETNNETNTEETADETEEVVDVVTTASIVDNDTALEAALSAEGTWIIATIQDVTTEKELVIDGVFYNKDDETQDLYRKLALYAQDADHNVTERYTLTAPKLTIKSENTKIQGGTFVGDVYVEANGFTVQDATIEGNVYFASEENKESFVLPTEEGKVGTVTGSIEVQ
ncbi:hypothetical protein [Clostridium sp. DL1XJH146]